MNQLAPLDILRRFSRVGRYLVYVVIIGLLANLSALIGLVLHPDISYFDTVHVIVGAAFALITALLCAVLESHIHDPGGALPRNPRSVFFPWTVVFIWTMLLIGSLAWFEVKERQRIHTVAMNEASTIFEKDLLYYRWAASQEGVYVPVSPSSHPNPILEDLLPESRILTDDGRTLALVNPEFMIRQVYDLQTAEVGPLGHITSLDPLWIGNTADPWERQALLEFEQGGQESWSIEKIEGRPYFRLMRPMITEEGCLRCHAVQGYTVGDIRGGISVSVPMNLLYDLYRESLTVVAIVHGALWLIGLVGIFLGSSRISASIQEREQAEARMRAIIDHMHDGLLIINQEAEIDSLNNAAAALFGYPAAEIEGRRLDFLIRLPAADDYPGLLITALRKAMTANRPLNGQRKDGDLFPLDISLSKMRLGDQRFYILILRDITEEEQHRSESLRASQLAALGELAAGVAHEINNPINGIINYSQVLLDDIDPVEESPAREILPRIIKESERVAAIVKNLLAFARQRDEVVEDLSLKEVIDDCVSLLLYQFEKDGIKIEMDIPDDLPRLRGNPQHLRQVFLNLLSNARYALNQRHPGRDPEKKIEIKSRLIRLQEDRPYIRTTLTDYGVGIAKEVIDRIFDALFTTKPPGEGTGLGLGISKGLVRDHNGQLLLESVPGQYTTATVDLPVQGVAVRSFKLHLES